MCTTQSKLFFPYYLLHCFVTATESGLRHNAIGAIHAFSPCHHSYGLCTHCVTLGWPQIEMADAERTARLFSAPLMVYALRWVLPENKVLRTWRPFPWALSCAFTPVLLTPNFSGLRLPDPLPTSQAILCCPQDP